MVTIFTRTSFFFFFSSGYGSVEIDQLWSSKAVDTAHSTVPVPEAAPGDTVPVSETSPVDIAHSTVPVSEAVPVRPSKEVPKPKTEVVHNEADSSSSMTERHNLCRRHVTVHSQKRKRWDSTSEDNDANKYSSSSKRSKRNTHRRSSRGKSPDRHKMASSSKKGERARRTSESSGVKSDPPSRRIVSGFKGGSLQITILRGQLFSTTSVCCILYFLWVLCFSKLHNHIPMQNNLMCKVISLNVRGIRDQAKRRSIFSFLKDQKASIYFLRETYSELKDETIWQNEWGGKMYFSHGSRHSKGTCILIDPSIIYNVQYFYSDNSGRIVLITVNINGQRVSFCNVYAPNNPSEQLEFIQELNNCIIDKSELTNLIVGGDWNCTLTKKDKKGGKPWKPTQLRHLLLMTMEIFDLIDIQRARYPNLNTYSYVSKALNVKSRLDFILIAKNLSKFVKSTGIKASIAPDHKQFIFVYPGQTTPQGDQDFGSLITPY